MTTIRAAISLGSIIATCTWCATIQAQPSDVARCAVASDSSHLISVKDKGARGDGHTNDTPAIQKAIDEVAGTGGTVYVPDGVYMVRATGKGRLRLRSNMVLKLSNGAVLSAIPNGSASYSVLKIAKAKDVAVIGGTLQGDRTQHESQTGEWGMGIYIGPEAKRVTVVGVTAKDMWGDGFYVGGASDVAFCSVTATHNRRQGLSVVEVDKLLVTDSVFQETRGTRPSAGIDIEPDKPEQKVVNIRIQNSKFINNAGGGIMIAGKRGEVANVEIIRNVFEESRPILVENAPAVRSTSICDNRHIGQQMPSPEGLNVYADVVEVVSLQDDCRSGRDLRFEVKRQTKKKKRQTAN